MSTGPLADVTHPIPTAGTRPFFVSRVQPPDGASPGGGCYTLHTPPALAANARPAPHVMARRGPSR